MHTCIPSHDSKDPDIHVLDHPRRQNVTTTLVGLQKMVTYQGFPTRMVYLIYISLWRCTILVGNPQYAKIIPKKVNPRDIAGNTEEEEEEW